MNQIILQIERVLRSSLKKSLLINRQGQAMIEYLVILVFILIAFYGFTFSFKDSLAPAFKRITAVIRWPIP